MFVSGMFVFRCAPVILGEDEIPAAQNFPNVGSDMSGGWDLG